MRRFLIITAILVIGIFSFTFAETQQERAARFISSWVAQVQGTEPAPPENPEFPPVKCGTPAYLTLSAYRHSHPEVALAIQQRPDLPDSYGTQHFLIHFTSIGDSAVYEPDIDSLAGIPRHVTRVANVFEHVWDVEINSLGYQEPLADFGAGGDDRFDVYLVNLGIGYFGFTEQDSIIGIQATCHIEIENDFAESGNYHDKPLDAVKVTAAHEYFHAVQFSYDAFEFDQPDPHNPLTYSYWWEEASSTWMETVVYNSIKDYLGYLPSFYKNMWMGLGTFSSNPRIAQGIHPYASCVWPIFLTKRFGDFNVMRDIWERCGASTGYNTFPATDGALRANYQSDIASAFLEFEIWNFQTGPLADTVNYYTDGRHFPIAETTAYIGDLATISPFTIPSTLQFPQQFATNYFIMNSPGSTGGVLANFNGQDLPTGQKWRVALMGFRENDSQWHDIQVDETSGVGAGDWPAWNNYRCVVLIPTVTGLNPNYSTFSYTGSLIYDPTLTGGQENSKFGMLKTFPSPYKINLDTSLLIQYTLDKFYAHSELGYQIYDASGGLVLKNLGETNWPNSPGIHTIQWDGRNSGGDYIASGIYIILFRAGDNTATGKIAVINNTK